MLKYFCRCTSFSGVIIFFKQIIRLLGQNNYLYFTHISTYLYSDIIDNRQLICAFSIFHLSLKYSFLSLQTIYSRN